MLTKTNQILDKNQVMQKIKRIAFQIYEDNFQEEAVLFAGIEGSGYVFAQLLQSEFAKISPIFSSLAKVSLDKFALVQSNIDLDIDVQSIANKVVILTDDVLNTGRTLIYSLKPFLKVKINKLQTAVLIERNHKKFPVSADYVGYALSTTLKEHIEVVLEENERFGVYLS